MGFLDSFINGISNSAIKAYNSEDNDDYRNRGFENTSSNYGWYRCRKCGKSFRKGDMDIDHILPKYYGGDNTRENLQCICKHCNRSKQADTTETLEDLKIRKNEIKKQNKEDKKFIKEAMKYKDKV